MNANGLCAPKHLVSTSVPRPNWVYKERLTMNQNAHHRPLPSERGRAHTRRTAPKCRISQTRTQYHRAALEQDPILHFKRRSVEAK